MARGSSTLRLAICLALAVAAWNSLSLSFCGTSLAVARDSQLSSGRQGWRLDMMDVGPKGIG
eukprot:CAMPEP_0178402292 /NCGR_PEP_ID=MMETSP0689_2-20121128/16759_1 /TAXON_ID=160604 /ORGANISM="Amphidinium massartii, Strain CS-259" /LENGTH=61 /DNA_ID=CAMNT_0020023173 /DNA_START=81 /DNA_END=262 /DNA_ORIENTATION=+